MNQVFKAAKEYADTELIQEQQLNHFQAVH